MAKMYATDVLMRSPRKRCRSLARYSCSDEFPIGRYFRDAKFFQIIEGTNEIHRTLIADYTSAIGKANPRCAVGSAAGPGRAHALMKG